MKYVIFNVYCVKGAILLSPWPRCPLTFFLGQCVPWMMCPCTIHSLRGIVGVGLLWVVLGWDWRVGGRAYFIRSICRVRWSKPTKPMVFLRVSVVIAHCLYVVLGQVTSVLGTLFKGHIVQGTHSPRKNVRGHIGHGHIVASWIVLSRGNSEVSDGLLCLSFPWKTCIRSTIRVISNQIPG